MKALPKVLSAGTVLKEHWFCITLHYPFEGDGYQEAENLEEALKRAKGNSEATLVEEIWDVLDKEGNEYRLSFTHWKRP